MLRLRWALLFTLRLRALLVLLGLTRLLLLALLLHLL
jgi:hypothetical protein